MLNSSQHRYNKSFTPAGVSCEVQQEETPTKSTRQITVSPSGCGVVTPPSSSSSSSSCCLSTTLSSQRKINDDNKKLQHVTPLLLLSSCHFCIKNLNTNDEEEGEEMLLSNNNSAEDGSSITCSSECSSCSPSATITPPPPPSTMMATRLYPIDVVVKGDGEIASSPFTSTAPPFSSESQGMVLPSYQQHVSDYCCNSDITGTDSTTGMVVPPSSASSASALATRRYQRNLDGEATTATKKEIEVKDVAVHTLSSLSLPPLLPPSPISLTGASSLQQCAANTITCHSHQFSTPAILDEQSSISSCYQHSPYSASLSTHAFHAPILSQYYPDIQCTPHFDLSEELHYLPRPRHVACCNLFIGQTPNISPNKSISFLIQLIHQRLDPHIVFYETQAVHTPKGHFHLCWVEQHQYKKVMQFCSNSILFEVHYAWVAATEAGKEVLTKYCRELKHGRGNQRGMTLPRGTVTVQLFGDPSVQFFNGPRTGTWRSYR